MEKRNDSYKISSVNIDLLYPSESDKVKCYMKIIIEDLEKQYNNDIPQVMIFSLDMMADLLRLYFKAQREFQGAQIIITAQNSPNGRTYMNPLVGIIQETNKQIIALAEKLGVTMFSRQKMKLVKDKVSKTKGEKQNEAADVLKKLLE